MNQLQAPRKIRLLFVISDLGGGGAQRVTLALLAYLDRRRYDITLLVLAARGALSSTVPADIRVIHLPPLRWLRLGQLMTLWLALFSDVLVATMELRTTYYVHRASTWLRKPAVLWVHIAFGEYVTGLGQRHQRRSRAAYLAIPNVVFVAEGARRSLASWLGREHEQWRVIPNLFSADAYDRSTAAVTAIPELQALAGKPVVLGAGRLEFRKGFDVLIDAAVLLKQRGVDFHLVIIGDGEQRASLSLRAERAGVGDRLLLPGFTARPLDWMRAATVYVLSSRLEGLPTTIIEAFACGTPVVASDCPSGPAELLDHGRAGLLVAVDDAVAMADALQEMLGSEALRQRFSNAARERLQCFRPELVCGQWDEMIASLQ